MKSFKDENIFLLKFIKSYHDYSINSVTETICSERNFQSSFHFIDYTSRHPHGVIALTSDDDVYVFKAINYFSAEILDDDRYKNTLDKLRFSKSKSKDRHKKIINESDVWKQAEKRQRVSKAFELKEVLLPTGLLSKVIEPELPGKKKSVISSVCTKKSKDLYRIVP
jgi:hypothetical protein